MVAVTRLAQHLLELMLREDDVPVRAIVFVSVMLMLR